MYICICQEVTDREIKKAADQGICSIKDLRKSLNIGSACGRCLESANGLLKEHLTLTNPAEIQAS